MVLMSFLMDSGADTDWTEPNGAIVNEAKIRAWCAMSYEQIESQSKFDCAFCETSWYTYRYPLYATQSDIDAYKEKAGLGFTRRRWYEQSEPSVSSEPAQSNKTASRWAQAATSVLRLRQGKIVKSRML